MQEDTDRHALVALLKACARQKDLRRGTMLHAAAVKMGLLATDVFAGSALVNMYAKCGLLSKAQEVFDELPIRNVVSWSALIAGYAYYRLGHEALKRFERMQLDGISPDSVTYICALKACGSIGAAGKGQEIHAKIVLEGLLKENVFVGTALVDMYAKCGLLLKAQEVFDTLSVQDVVSWSALIGGYAQHGYGEEALSCFERMQLEGFVPNAGTIVCALKACGSMGAEDKGQDIHAEIAKEECMDKQVLVGTALVDMYAKCGLLVKAYEVFDKLLVRDVVSWSALIAGYVQYGQGEDALNYFERMRLEGICPNEVTFTCILKACGCVVATDKGEEIHAEIVKLGLLENNSLLGTALVDMYGKCGVLTKAQEVFDKLPIRNVVLWNALLAGYALIGKADNVFCLFDKMLGEAVRPDLVTFTSLLSACSHTGLLNKGQVCFETMSTCYGITPTLEHYTCMVDLFGRAGHLEKVVALINEMPFSANLAMWHTVLNASRKWGDVELGRMAFQHAVHLDEKHSAAYVCMSNIYTDFGYKFGYGL